MFCCPTLQDRHTVWKHTQALTRRRRQKAPPLWLGVFEEVASQVESFERGVEQGHGVDWRGSRQVVSSPSSAPDFVDGLRTDRKVLFKGSAGVQCGATHP